MSARFFLYRRNGLYYFRWTIPLACRQRMPRHTPGELRISLRTHQYNVARRLAAQHWLAAHATVARILAANSLIRYKDLLHAIRGRVSMEGEQDANEDGGGKLVSLGTLLGTAELPRLHNAIAVLQGEGADVFVEVFGAGVTLWDTSYSADGELVSEVIEVLDQFTDTQARLTRKGFTAALAAEKNLFDLHEVHSDQPGMWRGESKRRHYYNVVLTPNVPCNLSSLRVAAKHADILKPPMVSTVATVEATQATTPTRTDCQPIRLSKARETWLGENSRTTGGTWTASTVSNNGAAIAQFIDIVGDKLTTQLTADDFAKYERVMRTLPADWAKIRRKTDLDFEQIALKGHGKAQVSPKTLKDKGSSIAGFFTYLAGKGYWHGQYGKALFKTVRQRSTGSDRHTFSDSDLQQIFAGRGLAAFEKAKFPLYVWGTILLLYTGARPAEISQLKRKDVIQDPEGTWYLQLREDSDDNQTSGPTQALKNTSSYRAVPLHPAVIDLGFLSFIKRFKDGDWLFPEAFRHTQKTSQEIGDWVNTRLLVTAGLKAPGVVLYSLRHTVINRFKHDARLDHLGCAYTGHSTAGDGAISNREFVKTYGKNFSPTELASNLHPLLTYDIDWTGLKRILEKNAWT